MTYTVVGLGNPGEAYEKTRHNAGSRAVLAFAKKENLGLFSESKKYRSRVAFGALGKEKILLLLPETFMNKSGVAVTSAVKSKKGAERLVVVHDDLDLPLGSIKISYARSSGGHRGVESVIRALKTNEFVRVRIGVSGATPTGKLKKPKGEKAVLDFILKQFSAKEEEILKKTLKRAADAIAVIIRAGRQKAMGEYN